MSFKSAYPSFYWSLLYLPILFSLVFYKFAYLLLPRLLSIYLSSFTHSQHRLILFFVGFLQICQSPSSSVLQICLFSSSCVLHFAYLPLISLFQICLSFFTRVLQICLSSIIQSPSNLPILFHPVSFKSAYSPSVSFKSAHPLLPSLLNICLSSFIQSLWNLLILFSRARQISLFSFTQALSHLPILLCLVSLASPFILSLFNLSILSIISFESSNLPVYATLLCCNLSIQLFLKHILISKSLSIHTNLSIFIYLAAAYSMCPCIQKSENVERQ